MAARLIFAKSGVGVLETWSAGSLKGARPVMHPTQVLDFPFICDGKPEMGRGRWGAAFSAEELGRRTLGRLAEKLVVES